MKLLIYQERKENSMRLSNLDISTTLLGIALILVSNGSARTLGLAISFIGFLISLISCISPKNKS